jgi:hypothetical protein
MRLLQLLDELETISRIFRLIPETAAAGFSSQVSIQ